jgi:hypothetical protein
MKMTQQQIDAILADPCASYWLKNALAAALKRDPIDAMHDAEFLAKVLRTLAK